MNKKKILFVFPAMYLGGAERSLIGLLNAVDTEQYEVDLFLFRHVGELLTLIPSKINLLREIKQYRAIVGRILSAALKGCPLVAYGRLCGKFKASRYVSKHHLKNSSGVCIDYSHRYVRRFLPKINPDKKYDLAVSFITPHYIVAEKVNAKKKLAWIHTDYSSIDFDAASQQQMWQPFDAIIAVSDQCKATFARMFPCLEEKLITIENILSVSHIREQALHKEIPDMPADGCIRILSVGRFCVAKNFDNIPDICSRILASGLNVKWYLIGYGDEEALIRQRITEAGMEDRVIILGKKDNPYPYIAACDIYVQPSRFEGKAVTVREAQILSKPVIITAFPTSRSQLQDGYDGLIVPLDNESCACEIAKLLKDPAKMDQLVKHTMNRDYSNCNEIQKLYSFT